LSEIQGLDVLFLAGEIFIPAAVEKELRALLPGWRSIKKIHQASLDITYAVLARRLVQANLLDSGEAESIALARQLKADWFLTDDAAARVLAASIGLEVHGSLGVLLWAAAQKHIAKEAAASLLERLAQSSLWISARILKEAQDAIQSLHD